MRCRAKFYLLRRDRSNSGLSWRERDHEAFDSLVVLFYANLLILQHGQLRGNFTSLAMSDFQGEKSLWCQTIRSCFNELPDT